MKKLFVLVLGLSMVCPVAFARNCVVAACPYAKNSDEVGVNHEYIPSAVGGKQCYSCDSNDYAFGDNRWCEYGAIIGQLDKGKFRGKQRIVGVYTCVDTNTARDEWHDDAPNMLCKNETSELDNPSKAPMEGHYRAFYSLDGGKTQDYSKGDNVIRSGGHDGCVYYLCEDGYVPNKAKTECVTPDTLCTAGHVYIGNECVEKKSVCEATGGTWEDNKTCTCDAKKQITQSSDKYSCECLSSEYSWYSDKAQGCYNKAAQSAREKCVNSGGSWNGSSCSCSAAKHLKLSNGECICESADYAFNSSKQQCELTDVAKYKQICDSATNIATWNAVENKCICNDKNKTFDDTIKNCISPNGYDECIARSDIAKWENDHCVCKQDGYVWKDVTCVEGDNKIVNGFVDKIVAIEKTFDTSKWKNAEGKFNTARLASDSIAGVVLGTVGGVVTSTVVKKNQVKNGFEDIKCVIGGQTVASWGDQINVGLQ